MSIVFYKNISLTDANLGGGTSTVGEPNVANNGDKIFYTGNWYATRSYDGGGSWSAVNPYTTLPKVDGGFCCDQTLIYERSRDILVWILQYIEENGRNTLRVAISPGAAMNNWYWWDFQPAAVNTNWDGEWFDYNHVSTSDNFLYVGTNAFTISTPSRFARSVIFRFPLDALANGSNLDYRTYSTTTYGSLRCVQGARDVMYFASHSSTSQIRVFKWPENTDSVSAFDVNVSLWSRSQPYFSASPDGNNWLSRCDHRITGGAIASDTLTFAWTSNKFDGRPWPYVRVVNIDAANEGLISEPDIWNQEMAFAYPALCPNNRGDLGITLFAGGGAHYPGHVVGVRDTQRGVWDLAASRYGTNGPDDGKWGDYIGILPYSDSGASWFASGYTLRGGSNRTDIEPRVVQFGFRS
jgi:hypothetical protein